MLKGLNQLIIRVSQSAWRFIGVTLIAVGALLTLIRIGKAFPAVAGGFPPFDLQNELTAAQVVTQLAGYTDQARWMYGLFTSVDYVFPFAACLSLAAIGAFGMRHAFPGIYAAVVNKRLLPLLMIGALFDWCENVASLAAILSYPSVGPLPLLLVFAKVLKQVFMQAGTWLCIGLLIAAGVKWVWRRLSN